MQHITVVDTRLTAPRGEDFRAGALAAADKARLEALEAGEDWRLPMDHRIEENVELEGVEMASAEAPIPESNQGYRLLCKLGWRPGGGLGRQQQGIAEPVRLNAIDTGTRVGLGRQEVDRQFTAAEFVERRLLETEIQAEEDEERRARRLAEAERQARIREDVAAEMRVFYCEICHKQYKQASEMEAHLSSYDHHHRKRLAETRAMLADRGRRDRERRERRRAAKEMERMQAQAAAAQAAAVGAAGAPPLPPDGPPPPPPPEDDGDMEQERGQAGDWAPSSGLAAAAAVGHDGAPGGWVTAAEPEGREQQAGGWVAAGPAAAAQGQQPPQPKGAGGWAGGGGQAPLPAGGQQRQPQRSHFVSGGVMPGTRQEGQQQPGQQQQQQQQQAAYDPFAPEVAPPPPLQQQQGWQPAVGAPPLPPLPPDARLPPPPPDAPLPPLPPDAPPPPLPPPPPPPAAAPAPAGPPKAGGFAISLGAGGRPPSGGRKPLGGFSLSGGSGLSGGGGKRPLATPVFGSDSEEELES